MNGIPGKVCVPSRVRAQVNPKRCALADLAVDFKVAAPFLLQSVDEVEPDALAFGVVVEAAEKLKQLRAIGRRAEPQTVVFHPQRGLTCVEAERDVDPG
jgi:hypothetical protein